MERLTITSGPEWDGVTYFTTQRVGGYSQGSWKGLNLGEHCGDDPAHVERNRQLLYESLPSIPHWLNQVHGTQIYHAQAPLAMAQPWCAAPEADAAWTDTAHTVLAILTADCLPVVIADAQGSIVGVAHAGWRGLLQGVVERLFLQLVKQRPSTKAWRVWIGPAISQEVFEVGSEVRQAFIKRNEKLHLFFKTSTEKNKYYADLNQIAAFLLKEMTDFEIDISDSNACTYIENQQYYSYRKQAQTGRIATLAWLG